MENDPVAVVDEAPVRTVHSNDIVVNVRGNFDQYAAGRVFTFSEGTASAGPGRSYAVSRAGIDTGRGFLPGPLTARGFPLRDSPAWVDRRQLETVSQTPDLYTAAAVVLLAPYIRRVWRSVPDAEALVWLREEFGGPGGGLLSSLREEYREPTVSGAFGSFAGWRTAIVWTLYGWRVPVKRDASEVPAVSRGVAYERFARTPLERIWRLVEGADYGVLRDTLAQLATDGPQGVADMHLAALGYIRAMLPARRASAKVRGTSSEVMG